MQTKQAAAVIELPGTKPQLRSCIAKPIEQSQICIATRAARSHCGDASQLARREAAELILEQKVFGDSK